MSKIREKHEVDAHGTNTWTYTNDETGQRVTVTVDDEVASITYWERSIRGRYVMKESVGLNAWMGPLVARALAGFGP